MKLQPAKKTATALEKNHALRKVTSKLPKINFPANEIWLLAENRIFRPQILKITLTKYTMPKTTLKIACNDVVI